MADKDKKPFMQKLVEKRIAPIIDNLMYTCFYHYKDSTGSNITFVEYQVIIRDLLKCNIDRKDD